MSEKTNNDNPSKIEKIVPSTIAIKKEWEVGERTEQDIIKQLLINRGITDPEFFFNPDFEHDGHDPFLMPNMDKAIARIIAAIGSKEQIAVFGDYDADGIPGTALLVKSLRTHKIEPLFYLPDREKEGYGLNKEAIDFLSKQGTKVLITVDLGITNQEQIAYAKSKGIDVIVTDHHHIDEDRLPVDAYAIVHPNLTNSQYPFKHLAGGGVAWKVAQALSVKTGKPHPVELKWWSELPAISTVCDIVSMSGENRMLVYYGLKVLPQTRSLGLRALYRAAGIRVDQINEWTLGFQIGPRINAPGRIGHGALALDLLLTEDQAVANEIAAKIELQNRERQEQLEKVVTQALEEIFAKKYYQDAAIVLVGKEWPLGIIGLAAARVVEAVHRPVLLLTDSQDGIVKGSGRSIGSFNLVEALDKLSDHIIEHGGHVMAAGLKLKKEEFTTFRDKFVQLAASKLSQDDLKPKLKAEMSLTPNEATKELVAKLEQFRPHGPDNPRIRFVIEPLTITNIRQVGANQRHLKVTFAENQLEAIGFGLGDKIFDLAIGDKVAALGRLEINHWTDRFNTDHETIQIVLEDIRPQESSGIK